MMEKQGSDLSSKQKPKKNKKKKVFKHRTQSKKIILKKRNKQGEPNKFPCSVSGQSFQATAQGMETKTERDQ